MGDAHHANMAHAHALKVLATSLKHKTVSAVVETSSRCAAAAPRNVAPVVDAYGVVVPVEAVDERLDAGLVQRAQVAGGLARLLAKHHRLRSMTRAGGEHGKV
jgi:hypothetical protein